VHQRASTAAAGQGWSGSPYLEPPPVLSPVEVVREAAAKVAVVMVMEVLAEAMMVAVMVAVQTLCTVVALLAPVDLGALVGTMAVAGLMEAEAVRMVATEAMEA